MRRILIVGIGAGNPDHLTVQAIRALNLMDVIFIPNKGTERDDLRRYRLEVCARFIENRTPRIVEVPVEPRDPDATDYLSNVAAWHAGLADRYARLFEAELAENECGGLLVWGDPSLYDSSLRLVETVRSRSSFAFEYDIIPGISSVQVLAARHRVPLNRIGEPVQITTGRRLAEAGPMGGETIVVMLDGELAFRRLAQDDVDIHWGAYLGTEDEILVSGRLADVADEIERLRQDARDRKGWIMDTYLLRRRAAD